MDIIDKLLSSIDTMGLNAVSQMFSALVTDLLPVFSSLMVLYVAIWGFEMAIGRAKIGVGEFATRVIRLLIIYTVAFTWSSFEMLVVNTFTNFANGVGKSVCSSVMSQNGGLATDCSATQGLVNIMNAGISAATKISAAGGWSGWGLWLIALLLIVTIAVFIAMSIAMILIAKISLMVLLGLGPVFIGLGLFQFSSALTHGWLRQLAKFAVLQVIVYGLIGFVVMLMQNSTTRIANAVAQDGFSQATVDQTLTTIIPFVILVITSSFVIKNAMGMASGIVGTSGIPWRGPGVKQVAAGMAAGVGTGAGWAVAAGSMLQNRSGSNTMSEGSDTMSAGAEQVKSALKQNYL